MGSIDWSLFEDRTDKHCPGFGWIKPHSYKENELCVCYCCRLSLGTSVVLMRKILLCYFLLV